MSTGNTPEDKTRRNMGAVKTALAEAATAVVQFEFRTTDPAAREWCASLLDDHCRSLEKLAGRLRAGREPQTLPVFSEPMRPPRGD